MEHDHKLSFDGKGAAMIGHCSCGMISYLATFSPKHHRDAIKAEHAEHLKNMARVAEFDALCAAA